MCKHERLITKYDAKTARYQTIKVTCGKCVECLQQRRNSWAKRTELEMYSNGALRYKYGYFVTLTYDNQHIPRDSRGKYTLRIKDLQMFLDRLRKLRKFRYLACGEYGGTTFRPHYHLLLLSDELITDYDIKDKWDKGYINFKTMKKSYNDVIKTSLYMAKYIAKGECDASDVIDFVNYRNALKPFLPPALKHVRKPELYIEEIKDYYPTFRQIAMDIIGTNLEKCHEMILQRSDFPTFNPLEHDEEFEIPIYYDWRQDVSEYTKLQNFNIINYYNYMQDLYESYELFPTFDDIFVKQWTSFETPFVRSSQNWGYNPLSYVAVNNIPVSDIPLEEFIKSSESENPYKDYLEQSYTTDNINLFISLITYEYKNQTNVVRLALPSYLRTKIIANFPILQAAIRSTTTDSITKSVQDFRDRIKSISLTVPVSEINETFEQIANETFRKALAKYKKKISSRISFGE